METKKFTVDIGGENIEVELTNLTEQANGSAIVRQGNTVVLVTAVMAKYTREGVDYLPLMVDYEEKFYAAGRIKGSRWVKRETRPSEDATLVGRMIDRTIRPRFDQRIRNDIQLVATVLSIDDKHDPDIVSLLGASVAILTSDIPWNGPIAGVRVGKINGGFVINPSYEEREKSTLDLLVSGTHEKINMLEARSEETPEKEFIKAIEFALPHIQKLIEFQQKIKKEIAPQKQTLELYEKDPEFIKEIEKFLNNRLEKAIFGKVEKTERMEKVNLLKNELLFYIEGKYEDRAKIKEADYIFEEALDKIVHEKILKEGKRHDGRKLDEVRSIECQVGILPRTHGSGIFARGSTKALSVLTLGAPGEEQYIEEMEFVGRKRFIHHYNFPPYSTGDVAVMRGPGRREIGHGALAERALLPVVPSKDEFPYTIRTVTEILSSNGSTSMASVSSTSLALMDGGVPIKSAVSGIAMGLIFGDEKNYKILTDIQGPEDHHGDMDLKVAGTKNGITAMQMDVKIEGINCKILEEVLAQAKKARIEILDKMQKTISAPRPELSKFAPRILILKINPEKIRDVIGPGGKIINEIIAETGVSIDIEDDGSVFITSTNEESAKKAMSWIKNITREVKVGEMFQGKVKRILNFGAFVEILPGQEGLVHISELAPYHVEKVEDILRVGDIKLFKVKNIDDQGKISLSLKAAQNNIPNPKIQENKNGV